LLELAPEMPYTRTGNWQSAATQALLCYPGSDYIKDSRNLSDLIYFGITDQYQSINTATEGLPEPSSDAFELDASAVIH